MNHKLVLLHRLITVFVATNNQALHPVMSAIRHGSDGTSQGRPLAPLGPLGPLVPLVPLMPLVPLGPASGRHFLAKLQFTRHCTASMEFPITPGGTIAQINQLIGARGHTYKSMGNNMLSIKHSCSAYRWFPSIILLSQLSELSLSLLPLEEPRMLCESRLK